MLSVAAVVVSIGLVDSVNPSTVGPALYLAAAPTGARRVASFIVGVVAVNLLGGVILTFGPGRLLLAAVPRPGPHARHQIELVVGGAMLLIALALWRERHRFARRLHGSRRRVARSPAVLGAAIAAVELPTALPYFAVIATIVSSGRNPATQVALLALFNAAFVLPLCGILIIRSVVGQEGSRLLQRFDLAVQRAAPTLIPLLVAIVAAALLVAGTSALY